MIILQGLKMHKV